MLTNLMDIDLILETRESFHKYVTKNKKHHVLTIKLSNACDADCSYCFHKKQVKDADHMSFDMVKEIVNKIILKSNDKCFDIHLHGGEPTLHPQFKEIVKWIYENLPDRHKFAVQTNMNNLSKDDLRYLSDHKCGMSTSYDGLYHIQNRGYDHKYIKSNNNYGFVTVVNKTVLLDIDDQVKHLESYNACIMNPVNTIFCSEQDKIEPEDYFKIYVSRYNSFIKTGHLYIDVSRYIYPLLLMNSDCMSSICTNTVLAFQENGNITICDIKIDRVIANIKDIQSIDDLFESPGYLYEEKVYYDLYKKCQSCNFFKVCKSGCYMRVTEETGLDYYCESIKKIIQFVSLEILNRWDSEDRSDPLTRLLLQAKSNGLVQFDLLKYL